MDVTGASALGEGMTALDRYQVVPGARPYEADLLLNAVEEPR